MNPSPIRILKWLRWPNLVIVVLTLAFIRYGLIAPALHREGLFLSMDTLSFVLLSLLTVLITFAGYVINDICDQETDARNKPQKRAIGVWMTESKARAIYFVLILIGALLTVYLGWKEEKLQWIWIYPLAVYLLWLYSVNLKGSVFWGNLLVSLLCAAVALLIPFAEKEALLMLGHGRQLMYTLYFYAAFAGISNLLREVIKDAEDREGDAESNLKTLAVVYGLETSKKVALGIGFLLLLVLILFVGFGVDQWQKEAGFALLTLPFLASILLGLFKKAGNISWKALSQMAKILMLGGLLGLLFLL